MVLKTMCPVGSAAISQVDRYQYVDIEGDGSEISHIKTSIPQVYILGPLLFILYINDICYRYLKSVIYSFR